MAIRKPLVVIDGYIHQIPTSDMLFGVSEVDCVEVSHVGPDDIEPGFAVYVAGDGEVTRAQANVLGTANPIGLAKTFGTGTPDSRILVQVEGVLELSLTEWNIVTGDSMGLIPNELYYLNPALPRGSLTSVANTTSGQYLTVVGRALSATQLKIAIERAGLIP